MIWPSLNPTPTSKEDSTVAVEAAVGLIEPENAAADPLGVVRRSLLVFGRHADLDDVGPVLVRVGSHMNTGTDRAAAAADRPNATLRNAADPLASSHRANLRAADELTTRIVQRRAELAENWHLLADQLAAMHQAGSALVSTADASDDCDDDVEDEVDG